MSEPKPLTPSQLRWRVGALFAFLSVVSGALLSLALGPDISWREWPLVVWVLFLGVFLMCLTIELAKEKP
jgi:hypothetical protein